MNSQSVDELNQLAMEEGIELPMSAEDIATLEEEGHVVDLETGEVIVDGADLYVDSPAFD